MTKTTFLSATIPSEFLIIKAALRTICKSTAPGDLGHGMTQHRRRSSAFCPHTFSVAHLFMSAPPWMSPPLPEALPTGFTVITQFMILSAQITADALLGLELPSPQDSPAWITGREIPGTSEQQGST